LFYAGTGLLKRKTCPDSWQGGERGTLSELKEHPQSGAKIHGLPAAGEYVEKEE
jgi:hypothetical protein